MDGKGWKQKWHPSFPAACTTDLVLGHAEIHLPAAIHGREKAAEVCVDARDQIIQGRQPLVAHFRDISS